jgi:hypothetical protein
MKIPKYTVKSLFRYYCRIWVELFIFWFDIIIILGYIMLCKLFPKKFHK